MTATILETFYTLKEKGTFIRLRIPETGYTRIVIVSDINTAGPVPLITVDCSEEMADAVSAMDQMKLSFEFTGEDQLRYHFFADDALIRGNALLIKLPKKIERSQRRSNYRLIAPMESFFYFTSGARRKRVKMLNLSTGGASGILVSLKNGTQQTPPVKADQTILNLKLAFTTDSGKVLIPVRESGVIRIEDLPQKGRYLMAVSFTRMDEKHRAHLRKIICNEQRHMLKIRRQRA